MGAISQWLIMAASEIGIFLGEVGTFLLGIWNNSTTQAFVFIFLMLILYASAGILTALPRKK